MMPVRLSIILIIACWAETCAGGGLAQTIFDCTVGKKRVLVTALHGEFVYRFGAGAKPDITVVGSTSKHNLFYRQDMYANSIVQLRFVNGEYSYIVYSMDANPTKGSSGVSGLLVSKGDKKISDMSCVHHSELQFDVGSLPEDNEKFSAMGF